MMSSPQTAPRPRVVVTLETSAAGRSALEVAVRLATALNAELEGVFVEDTELLELAALPFLREIKAHSLSEERLSIERMQRDLRALARQAERMLAEATAALGGGVSFRIWRGRIALDSLHDQLAADVLSLARGGPWNPLRWNSPTRAGGVALVQVLTGAIERADATLDVAARLAASLEVPVRVLVPADEPACETLKQKAIARFAGGTLPVTFFEVADAAALANTLRGSNDTVLIVAGNDPLFGAGKLAACLDTLRCPIVMLR